VVHCWQIEKLQYCNVNNRKNKRKTTALGKCGHIIKNMPSVFSILEEEKKKNRIKQNSV
jgi:hypothetical protein